MRIVRLLLLALVSLLAACQGDESPPTACTDPVAATTVELADFAFRPRCLSADAGATITLDNTGDALHTFTVTGTNVDFDVDAGTSFEASLSGVEPGTYAVTCTLHPQMDANLTVG
ncbi:MAG: cupredoxin domain-containing protein [Actinomycetota bacterium]|nr:cupredoxin domain-containing protein [Actinomycetota bacterium]